jgi:hypothetical protein
MSDRTETASWPDPEGPWHRVTDGSRVFDHGRPWCAGAAGHPTEARDYPNADLHLPQECRSLTTSFDGVVQDLSGSAAELEVYAAAPFRFGEIKTSDHTDDSARIVLEYYAQEAAGEYELTVARWSLPLGEALRLGRRLGQLIDLVTDARLHQRLHEQ